MKTESTLKTHLFQTHFKKELDHRLWHRHIQRASVAMEDGAEGDFFGFRVGEKPRRFSVNRRNLDPLGDNGLPTLVEQGASGDQPCPTVGSATLSALG